MASYVPERGDVILLSFSPRAGREQSGRRPAIVLSPKEYNSKVGLSIMCPITNQVKGYPFEVIIPEEFEVQGVILSDQVKSFDWKVRDAEFFCRVSNQVVNEVLGKLLTLLSTDI